MLSNKDKILVSEVLMHGDRLAVELDVRHRHTVVAGVRSKSGNFYVGINCDGIHGTCAEVVAYANAVFSGDIDVETIVAMTVDVKNKSKILMPCGNCRQIFSEISEDISFIIEENGELKKKSIADIFPFPYFH